MTEAGIDPARRATFERATGALSSRLSDGELSVEAVWTALADELVGPVADMLIVGKLEGTVWRLIALRHRDAAVTKELEALHLNRIESRGPIGARLRRGECVFRNTTEVSVDTEMSALGRAIWSRFPEGRVLLAPILVGDTVWGAIRLGWSDPADCPMTADDVPALVGSVSLALRAAVAVSDLKESNAALAIANGEMARLYEIATAVSSTLDAGEILRIVVRGCQEIAAVPKAAGFLVDHAQRKIIHRAFVGYDIEMIGGITYQDLEMRGTIGAWDSAVAFVQRPSDSPRDADEAPTSGQAPVFVIPLTVKGEAVGSIAVTDPVWTDEGMLDEDSSMSIEMLAELASSGLTNATLYEDLNATLAELSQTRSSLVAAQRLEAVGQLAAGVAHEINTPIQFVSDNLTFMNDAAGEFVDLAHRLYDVLDGPVDSVDALKAAVRDTLDEADLQFLMAEVPAAISQTIDGTQRVATIVRALKEFSHPGAKGLTPTDINHVIENTVTVARNEWKYVAEMELDLDTAVGEVPALPGPLGQVILNLIVNSSHAIADRIDGADKGTIRITSRRLGARVRIEVRDTGGGIPEELWDRVFDPFFTTKEVGKGTGQGLAIARDVVAVKHNGEISFTVEPGVGTTFVLDLPDATVEGAAA